ncbi:organic cation transporter protein-like [Littorina saxatilis]|uniref:Major facilitator superfamily (MFS) profile domain-containing protein n=1 Tax=Littorina saxatilis TaxID=31220 RepID=A0AAN9FVW4_9CAEN
MQGKTLDRLVAMLSVHKRYQICLLILLGFNYLPLVFNHVVMAFFKGLPPYTCQVASPPDSANVSRYLNETVFEERGDKCTTKLYLETGENITVKCRPGQFQYNPSRGEKTIVSEWDLVCDNKHLANLATTIYFSGVMTGGLLFGYLSDLVGRRPVLLVTLYAPVVVGVAIAFAPSYLIFVLLRFVQGVLMQGLQTSSYVLAMEFFLPAQRPLVGCVMECFWGVTVVILPGLAYALPNWRHLQIAISVPSVLALFYICVIPESLRWLILKCRMDDAKHLVTKISSFNRLCFPKEVWEVVHTEAEQSAKSPRYHFLHLFKTERLRRRSLVLFYLWLTIATGYFGLTFNITSLPGDKYVNFCISGCVELAHYALSIWVMNKFGRKKPLLVCFLSAGVCCIIAASIPRSTAAADLHLKHISTAFAIIGRFFMAGLFSVIFVYTTELYPTVIRNIGMGSCLFWARLGGVIAPQINELGSGSAVLVPIMVFGCMMLLGGALLLLLPETHGKKLPDLISDVENPQSDDDTILGPVPYAEQELLAKVDDVPNGREENGTTI